MADLKMVTKIFCAIFAIFSALLGLTMFTIFCMGYQNNLEELKKVKMLKAYPDDYYPRGDILLTTFSSIVFMVSIIGFVATILESDIYMIWIYAFSLILIIAGNLGALLRTYANFNVERGVDKYIEHNESVRGNAFSDEMHQNYSCCGFDEPHELIEIPKSCFDSKTQELFKKGCKVIFLNLVTKQQIVIIALTSSNILVEFFASLFAFMFGSTLIFD